MRRSLRRTRWLCLLLLTSSCATYTELTQEARDAYYSKDFEASNQLWADLLDHDDAGDDAPLLLLERGMVRLAMGRYADAAKDLLAADERLEVLDFTSNPSEVGKYLFSEDSGLYRGPPYEKILAPTLISLSYAAIGDEEQTRTAANAAQSQVIRFERLDPNAQFPSPLADILFGLGAEATGDTQSAYTAFEKANRVHELAQLRPVMLRLLETNAKRFGDHWVEDFAKAKARWGEPVPLAENEGEFVVVVLNGRAPIKVGTRVELSEAQRSSLMEQSMTEIRVNHAGTDSNQASAIIARQSDLPMAILTPRPSRYSSAVAQLPDGRTLALEEVLDIDGQVTAYYNSIKGKLVAAALSRMAVRMAARVATYIAVRQRTDDGWVAFLAAVAAGKILEAADTPDTRCWTLLPKGILMLRGALPAGERELPITMSGQPGVASKTLKLTVNIVPGKVAYAVVVITD